VDYSGDNIAGVVLPVLNLKEYDDPGLLVSFNSIVKHKYIF